MEKTTIEILEEVNSKIKSLEEQLNKLKEQQKNLINYLNHDND